MKRKTYLLAADHMRAKVYEIELPVTQLTVVHDQVNFVGRKKTALVAANDSYSGQLADETAFSEEDEEFAKSLCQMLRSKYKANKFDGLVVIAPANFLAAILRQLDKACQAVLLHSAVINPAQLKKEDAIVEHLQGMKITQAG